ncbi:MAG: nucleotidyl transferase AbiEii/AbiGii toxin family protein [Coriobacteriaceae bacterium]|jgi:hypothetical protein|nr:nucleotidyl transferase AbiEii/AbiGii toxin family protein [Coriobacteriaceae bacterium]
MMLEGFHLRVSRIVLEAVGPYGFALGGGYALQAYGITNRPSNDIDSFVSQIDEGLFNEAEAALCDALKAGGLDSVSGYSDSWFRAIQVFDPTTDEAVVVDLGYDYRENEPVVIVGLGPVLDIKDVITGKIRALWDRQAARDFIDVDAIFQTMRWTSSELLGMLQKIRPEATPKAFAEILKSADTVSYEEYEGYGLDKKDITGLANRLIAAADSIS